jgi:transposase
LRHRIDLSLISAAGLISDEHFTVDGTLLEAWASLKSSAEGQTGLAEAG